MRGYDATVAARLVTACADGERVSRYVYWPGRISHAERDRRESKSLSRHCRAVCVDDYGEHVRALWVRGWSKRAYTNTV